MKSGFSVGIERLLTRDSGIDELKKRQMSIFLGRSLLVASVILLFFTTYSM